MISEIEIKFETNRKKHEYKCLDFDRAIETLHELKDQLKKTQYEFTHEEIMSCWFHMEDTWSRVRDYEHVGRYNFQGIWRGKEWFSKLEYSKDIPPE